MAENRTEDVVHYFEFTGVSEEILMERVRTARSQTHKLLSSKQNLFPEYAEEVYRYVDLLFYHMSLFQNKKEAEEELDVLTRLCDCADRECNEGSIREKELELKCLGITKEILMSLNRQLASAMSEMKRLASAMSEMKQPLYEPLCDNFDCEIKEARIASIEAELSCRRIVKEILMMPGLEDLLNNNPEILNDESFLNKLKTADKTELEKNLEREKRHESELEQLLLVLNKGRTRSESHELEDSKSRLMVLNGKLAPAVSEMRKWAKIFNSSFMVKCRAHKAKDWCADRLDGLSEEEKSKAPQPLSKSARRRQARKNKATKAVGDEDLQQVSSKSASSSQDREEKVKSVQEKNKPTTAVGEEGFSVVLSKRASKGKAVKKVGGELMERDGRGFRR